VTGGAPPAPLHPRDGLQVPVSHVNCPLHPVRAQNRPSQFAGAFEDCEAPDLSSKPVVGYWGLPALVNTPGHTVKGHLFVKVNVAENDPAIQQYKRIYLSLTISPILYQFYFMYSIF